MKNNEKEVSLTLVRTCRLLTVIIITTIIITITDMEFVQNFTPPDFHAKNFTPPILPNFNSFSKKKHKK